MKDSYSIRVRTTSEEGLFIEKWFLIKIKNVNEPPIDIVFYQFSIEENSTVGTVVGNFFTFDPDYLGRMRRFLNRGFSYKLIEGKGA